MFEVVEWLALMEWAAKEPFGVLCFGEGAHDDL